MSGSKISGHTAKVVSKALDRSTERDCLIVSGIDDMDTTGYPTADLDFNQMLKKAMADTEPNDTDTIFNTRFPVDRAKITDGYGIEDIGSADIHRLDSVKIDRGMVDLTENNIKYRTTTELLLRKMKRLRYAINEGGR